MQDMPFFMDDAEWYTFNGVRFVLTDKAPKEAQESYNLFYETENKLVQNNGTLEASPTA